MTRRALLIWLWHKVAAVLSYAHENAVEPFMEPALGICRALLERAADEVAADGEGAGEGAGGMGAAASAALDAVAPLLQLSPVLVECAAAGETEVAGAAIPQIAAEALRLLVELLPEESAAAVFHPHVPLTAAVLAMGSAAAVQRGESGFADVGGGSGGGAGGGGSLARGLSGLSLGDSGGGGRGGGAGGAGGLDIFGTVETNSPRLGFAAAQRTALGAVAAAARAAGQGSSGGGGGGGPTDAAALEAALRRLALGEPNPSIAGAAADAADSVAALIGR